MESLRDAVTPIPARASGPGPRHAHARARGGDLFHVRAAIGAARCAPGALLTRGCPTSRRSCEKWECKAVGSARHATCTSRRELQLRLSEHPSSSRSKPVPRCSHHKRHSRRGRRTHAPRPECPGRGIPRANQNRERRAGWERVDLRRGGQ